MDTLKQTFKKNQHQYLCNKYDETLDMLTATIFHAFKKQFHSIKIAVLIRRHVNDVPCLKGLDIKKIGLVGLKRKLSQLPLDKMLILEYQLDIVEGLREPLFDKEGKPINRHTY